MAPACTARPLFDAHFVTYPVEGSASLLETTDLNGDEHLDLVVASGTFQGPGYLTVLFGEPGGEFTTHDVHTIPAGPDAMELVDVDADGDQDLVTVHFRENWIRVYLQTETGVFRPTDSIATVSAPAAIIAGDLNLDRRMDLVVRPYWSDTLAVHLAAASGGFAPPIELPFEPYYALSFVIHDVTADGKPDLVFKLRSSIAVWPGDGLGGFGTEIRTPVGGKDFRLGDIDHDDQQDLAVVTGNSLVILLGRTGGTFVKWSEYPTARYGQSTAVTAGDLNHDGNLDVLVSNWQTYNMLTFLGHGDGTFTQGETLIAASHQAVVADATGDDNADVILPYAGIAVLPGNGDGSFRPRREFTVGAPGDRGFGHAVGDLDGDGHLDLVTANSGSGTTTVLRGQGDGDFSLLEEIEVGPSPYAIALGDFDADGRLDLVVGLGPHWAAEGTISVRRGRGDGSFHAPLDAPVGRYPSSIRIADFDADGRLDVVVATRVDYETTGGMTVLLGGGDGSFSSRHDYVTNPSQDLAVADFDEDGTADVVLVDSYGGVRSLLGLGNGEFAPGPMTWLQRSAWSVAAADVDSDNHVDLLVGTGVYQLTSSVDVLHGDGNGSFVLQGSYPIIDPLSIAIADLDLDGFLDVVTGSYSGRALTVVLGRGDGTFGRRIGYGAVGSVKQITVADVDEDGRPDLLVSNLFAHSISVLLALNDRTPVLVSGLLAEPREGAIWVEWDLAPDSRTDVTAIHVARGRSEAGPFARVSPALTPQSHMTFVDANPNPDMPWYRVEVASRDGLLAVAGPVLARAGSPTRSGIVAVAHGPRSVRIRYVVAIRGFVDLDIYDVRGRLVRTLVDDVRPAGVYSADWDWGTEAGRAVPRGVYFVQLRASDVRSARKIVLAGR